MRFEKQNSRYIINELEFENFFLKENKDFDTLNLIVHDSENYYYFKSNSKYTLDVTELFSSWLAEKAGLFSMTKYPAQLKTHDNKIKNGIISKDFINDHETAEVINSTKILIPYLGDANKIKQNSIQNHVNALRKLIDDNNLKFENFPEKKMYLSKNFIKEFKKYYLFYFLTSSEDMWANNIEFLFTNRKDGIEIALAPVDNDASISFLLNSFRINRGTINEIPDSKLEKTIEETFRKIKIPLRVLNKNLNDYSRKANIQEISQMINKDEDLRGFYNDCKRIDLNKLFKTKKKENDYSFISDRSIKVAAKTYEMSLSDIEAALNYEKIAQNGPLSVLKKINSSNDENFEL